MDSDGVAWEARIDQRCMLVELFETFREECSTCEQPEKVFIVGLFVSILELGVRNPEFNVGLDESNFLVEQGEV